VNEDARLLLDQRIAELDALIAGQLDAILHHPRLRRLEGSWRGLHWLLATLPTPAGPTVKVKLLNLSWAELCRDLERAAEFDQSQLFRKVYEEEFGSPGGEPFGLLVIDHEVRHRPAPDSPTDDVNALAQLASVAAAAFAPTVLATSPALLAADDFTDLATAGSLADPFGGPDHARWRTIASREDMRFVAVALPRLLARAPWRDDPARRNGFRYTEDAPGAAERVWMTAGYAFAAAVARAFSAHAWPADVRGSQTDSRAGGLVADAPAEYFASDPAWFRPSLDVLLTEQQERVLAAAGLMPVSALPFGQEAVFASVRSLQSPARYSAAAAKANTTLSAQFNTVLCVSRFAHYVKLIGRRSVGSFRSAEEIEQHLHEWLQGYVNANPASTAEARARQPLAAARVAVRERQGRPGVFGCTIHLQPHFQLDDIAATFRLVTELAAPSVAGRAA
jgi:type VI secretion system protein ImpD/type VI secretion system protein ImpC